jgi:hypothetical protein
MRQSNSKSWSNVTGKAVVQQTILATVFLVFSSLNFASAEKAVDACAKTANDVLRSCRVAAQSDFLLAVAKCDNQTPGSDCISEASAEKSDALQTCNDGFDVRKGACEKLGPDPYDPEINPANYTTHIDNPLFPLVPGTTFIYEGQTADGLEHDEFAVTHRTRVIDGVTCVEVHDTVRLNGKLTEDTLDWFAQDLDGNVWYFGENTHELENGLISTIDGSFQSGVDKAKPGIIMEAHPKVGDFYRQEFDLANAEDFAQVTGLNSTVSVPVGTFNKCLKTSETTPLEPDVLEDKFYARGVGNVLTIDRETGARSELIQIKTNQ